MGRLVTGAILYLCITFCMVACTKTVYVPVKSMEVTTVRLRDTIIKTVLVPYRDSISTPDTTSYLHNPYGESWAVWSGGKLNHSLNIYPDTLGIPIQIEEIEIIQTVEIPIEVEKKLTRWQQIKMDMGGWAIGALSGIILLGIGYGIFKFIKRKINIK